MFIRHIIFGGILGKKRPQALETSWESGANYICQNGIKSKIRNNIKNYNMRTKKMSKFSQAINNLICLSKRMRPRNLATILDEIMDHSVVRHIWNTKKILYKESQSLNKHQNMLLK